MIYEGYYPKETLPVKPGDTVIIPAGIPIRSTGPKGKYTSARKQTVIVHHILSGVNQGYTPIENPKVVWAGYSGYWCEADINEVIKKEGE